MRPKIYLVLLGLLAVSIAGVAQDAAPATEAPAAVPDLSGVWVLNDELSESMREQMREHMLAQNDNPRVRARWDRLESRSRQSMRNAPFGRLTIEHSESEVHIAYLGGRVRELVTDGSVMAPDERYGIVSSTVSWEGARLVVDSETNRGRTTEFWELSEDGTRLFITTQLEMGERFDGPISFRRVYDAPPPEEDEDAAAATESDAETGAEQEPDG